MKMDMLRLIGSTTVDLPIIGADASGPFVLKGADGLGPPDVNVRMVRTVLEKAVYQGKSVNPRQIIAAVGLQPDYDTGQTSEELRTILYGLLTPRYNQMVRAEIVYQGIVQAYAQGHISKFEAALFSKDPAVVVTLDCDYGYLLAPAMTIQEPVKRTGTNGLVIVDISNTGTAPSGFKMGITLRSDAFGGNMVISDVDFRGKRFETTGIVWKSGDRFVMDTRPGSRGVWRGAGGGALVSILNNIRADNSEWLELYGGDNALTIGINSFDWDPVIQFQHQPAYWGV